jgi:hypothetical protein
MLMLRRSHNYCGFHPSGIASATVGFAAGSTCWIGGSRRIQVGMVNNGEIVVATSNRVNNRKSF